MNLFKLQNNTSDEIIFLSDIHFGARGDSIEWLENIVDYFENFFIPFLKNRILVHKKTPVIIIAGDYFDNRVSLGINVYNAGITIMEKLSELCHVYMIVGNHDIFKKSSNDINSLRVFKYFENVSVVESASVLNLSNLNCNVGLIPWCEDTKEGTNLVNELSKDCKLIVMHAEINGMTLDNNKPILNGIDTTVLNNTKIYSGHIHKRQESEKCNYIGSPYHIKRTDFYNKPGIYYINFESDKLVEHFEPNTYSPVFKKIKYEYLIEHKDSIKEIISNNYVDIIIKQQNSKDVDTVKLTEELLKYNPRKIEFFIDKSDCGISEEIKDTASGDMSITDLFKKNVSKMNIEKIDAKKLDEMNEYYIKQANEILGGDII